MRIFEILTEFQLPKNSWLIVSSNSDKVDIGDQLVDLVKTAYSNAPLGSNISSLKDVIPSEWKVLDWDNEPDIDATVFYRFPRSNENWVGNKIQGIGHDGQQTSKARVIQKVREMLDQPGWWAETSDALRHVLLKMNTHPVTDEQFLQTLFDDPKLKMVDDVTYVRALPSGKTVKETVFGKPRLKKSVNQNS